jgi:preprotein translocase subunit SecE
MGRFDRKPLEAARPIRKSEMAKQAGTGKPNVFVRFTEYLKNVWRELKRVVWPNKGEVLNSSLVVVITLLFFVAFTFLVDSAVTYLVSLVGKIGG